MGSHLYFYRIKWNIHVIHIGCVCIGHAVECWADNIPSSGQKQGTKNRGLFEIEHLTPPGSHVNPSNIEQRAIDKVIQDSDYKPFFYI